MPHLILRSERFGLNGISSNGISHHQHEVAGSGIMPTHTAVELSDVTFLLGAVPGVAFVTSTTTTVAGESRDDGSSREHENSELGDHCD